jgi:signal transduction histidine kinase
LAYIAGVMNVRQWFVVVAAVSAGALGWLMWLLLDQDKTVELQRRQEKLEQAADRAAAIMQAALSDLDRDLPPGVLRIKITHDRLVAQPPTALLYYPDTDSPIKDTGRFVDGERAEFSANDLKRAAQIYAQLAAGTDRSIRAGALTRLARVERKLKDYSEALRAYDQLSQIEDVEVSGLLASLIAREGRAEIFEEEHHTPELRQEAAAFKKELETGVWRVTKSEYVLFMADVRGWLGAGSPLADADAVARAEAAAWLWENRSNIRNDSRRLIETDSGAALLVSRPSSDGLTAAIAGPKYLDALCLAAVPDAMLRCSLTDTEGRALSGQQPPARMVAMLTASASKLPWTLHVFPAPDTFAGNASPRRNLLLCVAALLGVVWLAGAAFLVRAIRREARASELQSDFVAAVSHEFRSPLSSLCQISEMLTADRLESEDRRRQAYHILASEAGRLRHLVEALLDFQRFEAGAAVYHFERLEIGEFLKSIVADFQPRVAAAGYNIELNGPQSPVYVQADREALFRAIWNLLDNAVKYSPENHTVWVEASVDRNHVSVAVQDRGLGIPVKEQHEIFEKFVRGADSKSRRIKGTGIGLAMVRHIVQAHGGEILLASRPGEGSRFTIVIPGGVPS